MMAIRRRKWFFLLLAVMLAFLAACSSNGGSNEATSSPSGSQEPAETSDAPKETVKLKFMYWGSTDEKKAMEQMLKSFNESHPHIQVSGEHVPGDYNTKMNTLMAANELPDVAYLGDGLTNKWGSEGKLLDFSQYYDSYPELQNKLKASYLFTEPGKAVANFTALEIMVLYYNKDIFSEAGVSLPPSDPMQAWTWDEFVSIAKKLTKDTKGRNAEDPDFDEKNIDTYGFSFGTDRGTYGPLLESNGAGILDDSGKSYALNEPEAVEVFQKLQDLIYVHHVSPNLIQQQNMPDNHVRLQTRKVAMVLDGTWALLDLTNNKKLNYGIGVLPKLKEPKTVILAGTTVVFNSTKHPAEALEFYLYHNNPDQVDLYRTGLWMPTEEKYYTEEAAIKQWTDNPAHPPEFLQAGIEYTKGYAVKSPSTAIKNWPEINSKLTPGLDLIWTNKKTAQEALDELKPQIEPLIQGEYPNE
ncbi:multiple sugar transport system substrate-binding protein [Paenibacillus endophyticus]|uniref:Multiple sugar transport system substrate-binding protein n=1 Tax=Paenibacillus endophyticus TaxID=1294268 RepID=A0A7W5GCB6_9BACL|nr:sugar ABC transporter substrate-binding protein [Paenibacillus endophyticus]MBB3154676.1 multiple sugar transport system substrate-binding protein [Paenibacillus endophyticus]